jgi:hypothetical protein
VCLGILTVALLVPTGSVRAGDRETALALIEQGIKAHGGEAGLMKAQNVLCTGAGVLLVPSEVKFTYEVIFGLPGRTKQVLKLDKAGQIIMVVNLDRGWRSAGGAIDEMPKEALDDIREEVYVDWLITLVPLKKAGFDLAPTAEKMVDGNAATGIKVSSKGHTDVRLYFDKTSGLLVKAERVSKEAGFAVNKEYVYSNHKEFDGVKLPTKRTEIINGKKFLELTPATYRFLPKADDAAFGKP